VVEIICSQLVQFSRCWPFWPCNTQSGDGFSVPSFWVEVLVA